MKSSLRFWLAAAVIVGLSLAPKVTLGVLRDHTSPPPARSERLRAFLAGTGVEAVAPIREEKTPLEIAGWRFRTGGCSVAAFPSGPRGTFDQAARNEARVTTGARMSYFYRGAVTSEPPTWSLALDILTFRALSPFTPSRALEPGYTVLVYSEGCVAPTHLPWGRFTSD